MFGGLKLTFVDPQFSSVTLFHEENILFLIDSCWITCDRRKTLKYLLKVRIISEVKIVIVTL